MEVKYVKYKFTNTWQAVEYFEDGSELYITQDEVVFTRIENIHNVLRYQHRLYTKEIIWGDYELVCEDDLFNLKDDLDAGLLYCDYEGNGFIDEYEVAKDNRDVILGLYHDTLYRKVE